MKSLSARWFLPFLGIILILGLVTAGCAPKPSEVVKESIRIGYSASLTGMYSPGWPSQGNAVILWSEQVNEKGGIYVEEYGKRLPVELVYYDDKGSPEDVIKIYERLITVDKVDLLFPPFGSTLHTVIYPTIEKYGIPLVGSTASSMELKNLDVRYFWLISAFPDSIMPSLVEFLSAHKDELKTVAVLYVGDVFELENERYLRPALEAAGFDIVLYKDYPFGTQDLAPVLAEVKRKNPDIVIALNAHIDWVLWMKQSMEAGLNPKLFYYLLGPGTAAFYEIFGPATEGITFFSGNAWTEKSTGPGSKEFYDSYVERWGQNPDYLDSAIPWVASQVIEQAIEKAGTLDHEKIRDVIATEEFMTIFGPVKFENVENIRAVPGVLQVQKGKPEIVWPSDHATAELVIPKQPWP